MYDDQPLRGIGKQNQPVWVKIWGLVYASDILIQKTEKPAVWSCVYPRAAVALPGLLLSCKYHSFLSESNRLLTSTYTSAKCISFDAPIIYRQGRSEPPRAHLVLAAGGFSLLFPSPKGTEATNILQHLLPSSL